MSKGKIVQVCAIDTTIDKLLRELIVLSVEEGYDVISICSKGKSTAKLIGEGFSITNINIDRSIKPISNIKSVINMYEFFKTEKPDIVHVHTPVAAVLGRIAAKLAGVPNIVYTAHGFYFHDNMKSLVYKLTVNIEKYMAKLFTDFLFTQSEEDALTAVNYKFLEHNKILAIGNGVDVWGKFNPENINKESINKLKEGFGLSGDDKVITFIGRLVREKGILDLLEVFDSISERNVKLLIVGDMFQGDRDSETVQLIEKYKSNRNIIFTGIRDDINYILYLTDIFCLPSYREGMPRSIIEAMAMQCAVVATNIRGSREEVVDGETGYLVPVSKSRELKDKLEMILDNSKLMESMKHKGRKRAEKLYDEKIVVKKQLNIFKNLLNKQL